MDEATRRLSLIVALQTVASRLVDHFEVEQEASEELVQCVALHTQPSVGRKGISNRLLYMVLGMVLLVPWLVAFIGSKLLRLLRPNLTEGVLVGLAATLFVVFPLVRRALGVRTRGWMRGRVPDGLAALASDGREPVLYLRSHRTDGTAQDPDGYWKQFFMSNEMKTIEEHIARVLELIGPVVALRGPHEQVAHLGAARISEHGKRWKMLVRGLIARAAVVVVRFRPSDSMCWEVDQLLRFARGSRIVFVLSEPRGEVSECQYAWRELRKLLPVSVRARTPEYISENDCFLGFDDEFEPRIFGRESRPGKCLEVFLDSLLDAIGYGDSGSTWRAAG